MAKKKYEGEWGRERRGKRKDQKSGRVMVGAKYERKRGKGRKKGEK